MAPGVWGPPMARKAPTNAGGAFDPLAPFQDKRVLEEVVSALAAFRWKLYGPIPVRFHRGEPTPYEFDLNLGVVHVTEQDAQGLSEIFRGVNARWATRMTYCLYPSKDRPREIILNVRGSPRAPAEID